MRALIRKDIDGNRPPEPRGVLSNEVAPAFVLCGTHYVGAGAPALIGINGNDNDTISIAMISIAMLTLELMIMICTIT